MPGFVAAILDSKFASLLGRILLTFMFWSSAIEKTLDWKGGVGAMAHFHLNPPDAFNAATILVQAVGSLLVIFGPYAWLGAGALSVFTILTIPIAHTFWAMPPGPMQMNDQYTVIEHLSICGALLLVSILRMRELAGAKAQAAESARPIAAPAGS